MAKIPYPDNWYDIDTSLYNGSVKVFSTVKKMLSVKLKLHAENQVQQGDIFLFNHFSRFETFIPQYLIYEQTGAYSCAIGSGEFFAEDTVLARYLQKVGVFPHDHDRLFALLAAQILRGRKVVIFPEGGMVKDHRVLDPQGRYSIYSRITGRRRKQHTGAAVLAQGIAIVKDLIKQAETNHNQAQLDRWQQQLHFDSLEQLLQAAHKPTLIVPANITFYPIRSDHNLLLDAVELFANHLSARQTEELLIEGNILLKNTDMDIRLGKPLAAEHTTSRWQHYLLLKATARAAHIDAIYALSNKPTTLWQRYLGWLFKNSAVAMRDRYMQAMYALVTINLSHLAATLIMYCLAQGQQKISQQCFFTSLYIAVKHLQQCLDVHLHRSLLNPYDYSDLASSNPRFEQFIRAAKDHGLLSEQDQCYHFLPKLLETPNFDEIRLENIIAVYDNEARPITTVRQKLIQALTDYQIATPAQFAAWHFDDECRDLSWERHHFSKPCFDDINSHETANADASPFFLKPQHGNGLGVLLIHGLLASPAELKAYGEYLYQQGYTVLGVRLKGHGSSPCALREQTLEDWFSSVQRGFNILKAHSRQLFICGFSTGGALALKLAAEHHPEICGVCVAAVPIKFINPAFTLVSFLYAANQLVDWLSSYEGVKPFIDNHSEHPAINYRNVPVKSLYQLRRLIHEMDTLIPRCPVPVLVLQGDHDPVVAADSAAHVFSLLPHSQSQLKLIASTRHGILMENIGASWQLIDAFIQNHLKSNLTVQAEN